MTKILKKIPAKKMLLLVLTVTFVAGGIFIPFGVDNSNVVAEKTLQLNEAHAHTCPEGTRHGDLGPDDHRCLIEVETPRETGSGDSSAEGGGFCIFGLCSSDIWNAFAVIIGNTLLELSGLVLWLAGILLNIAVDTTVVGMADLVKKIGGVDVAWRVIRDFANMVFIFVLLYISIATILRIEGYGARALLTKLIIAALLVNFSLFFTKVVIDSSNILTKDFLDQIEAIGGSAGPQEGDVTGLAERINSGFSGAFVAPLQITTIYDTKPAPGDGVGVSLEIIEPKNIFTIAIFGSIFILTTAFIFFAASILLIIRFAVLVLLMILSPLAFIAIILPNTRIYWNTWVRTLLSQAFFAPFYMALMLMVAIIANSERFRVALFNADSPPAFTGAFTGVGESVVIVLNFAIISTLMIASIIVAKQLGAHGASTVMAWGKSAQRWGQGVVGRGALGRPARLIAESGVAKKFREAQPRIAGAMLKPIEGIAGAKFGSKRSAVDIRERKEKDIDINLKRFQDNPEMQAQYIANLPRNLRSYAYGKMSARGRAEVERKAAPQHLARIQSLRQQLSIEEQEKTDKARKEAEVAERDRRNRDIIHQMSTGGTVPDNPATGAPYTPVEALRELRPNQARKLSHEARVNPEVIKNLTARHLRDLMNEGNLLPDEISAILAEISGGTAYLLKQQQKNYVNDPANMVLWGLTTTIP